MHSGNIISYHDELKRLETSLDPNKWNVKQEGQFVYFLNAESVLLEQGWQIHVSCQASELSVIIDKVIPVIIHELTDFKIVSTYEKILALNFGSAGKSEIGKIITIYPNNAEEAYSLGKKLDGVWFGSSAPCPPNDLFFSIGGNVSLSFESANGKCLVNGSKRNEKPVLVSLRRGDIYGLNGKQIGWTPRLPGNVIPCPFYRQERSSLAKIENGRYEFLYQSSIKTFSSVFFCFDKIQLKTVLVKIFHKRAGEDRNGYLLIDKARNETSIANILSKHNLSARIISIYEDDFFYYTISEYVLSKTYAELTRDERIERLPEMLSQLQKMHDLGFVHRDLKLANVMVSEHALYFGDFELSGRIKEIKPFVAETYTYTPPEGAFVAVHSSYDSFFLGDCIIHSYTGAEPRLMPGDPLKRLEVSKFYIPAKTRELIKLLYASDPNKRPGAKECIKAIMKPSKRQVIISERGIEKVNQKITELLGYGLAALENTAIFDGNGAHWNSLHRTASDEFSLGLNTGIGGTLLGILTISKATSNIQQYRPLVEKCISFIESKTNEITHANGMFSGIAGAVLAMGAVIKVFPDIKVLDLSYRLLKQAANNDNNFDLYSGYAGIAYVAMQLFNISHQYRFMKIVDYCIKMLVENMEVINNVTSWKAEKTEKVSRYETGVAHGTIGIAFVMGLYGIQARSAFHFDIAKRCFIEVFKYARDSEQGYIYQNLGNSRHGTINKTWCHGEAGYLWAIIQIPELFEDLKSEIGTIISDCLKISHLSNPTYCHGMAGSLEMWRLVNKTMFGNKMTKHCYLNTLYELSSLSQRFGTYELFSSEENSNFSPDLWVGFVGPLSSLALAKLDYEFSILKIDS